MRLDPDELNERIAGRWLLIDLDGTLVDSSASVTRAWSAWASRYDVPLANIFAISEGRQGCAVIRELRPDLDAEAEDAWLIDHQVNDVEGVTEIPGATEFLRQLPQERWAIVTSCTDELARARLNAAGLPVPDILISASRVSRSKPAPDAFALGRELLQASPNQCVAFEDSEAGIESARRAGIDVVAITHAARMKPQTQVDQINDWLGAVWRNQ